MAKTIGQNSVKRGKWLKAILLKALYELELSVTRLPFQKE
jgi:hypothetical protein